MATDTNVNIFVTVGVHVGLCNEFRNALMSIPTGYIQGCSYLLI